MQFINNTCSLFWTLLEFSCNDTLLKACILTISFPALYYCKIIERAPSQGHLPPLDSSWCTAFNSLNQWWNQEFVVRLYDKPSVQIVNSQPYMYLPKVCIPDRIIPGPVVTNYVLWVMHVTHFVANVNIPGGGSWGEHVSDRSMEERGTIGFFPLGKTYHLSG